MSCLGHASNKRRLMPFHKLLYGWQSVHKGRSDPRTRHAAPNKHEGSYPSLDEGCPLVGAITDTIIPREHNPAMAPYLPEPLLIACVLGEMVIVHLDCCSCLPESIGHNALPKTTIEEKDERVYAAWRLSSHRIASSISRGGRS